MTRTNDSFAAAREERIKVSGKPDQYDDLSIFIREQELMRQLVSDSMLPVLRVDISDDNVSNAVGTIADWLETTGGLYLES
jgi:hypothetical protein